MIKFNVTDEEKKLIQAISKRASALAASCGGTYDEKSAAMDITAAHANGNRIKLNALLKADDLNFAHDVFGIRSNLNRRTGKLVNFFVPRFSDWGGGL